MRVCSVHAVHHVWLMTLLVIFLEAHWTFANELSMEGNHPNFSYIYSLYISTNILLMLNISLNGYLEVLYNIYNKTIVTIRHRLGSYFSLAIKALREHFYFEPIFFTSNKLYT